MTIDVGRIGTREPDRALVILSGTHGVEGFCGSGCQVGFFVDHLYRALPASACALLVHALNPFGFAWLRRVNEDGVDLNRNFIDFSKVLPSSTAYEALHDYLVPADWKGEGRRAADRGLDVVDPALRTEIQLQMRNAFYCESADWQAAVYGRTADFIYRACRGLATSSSL